MSALYSLGKFLVAPPLRLLWRPKVSGLSNIPAEGAVILAANHLSVVDSIVVPVVSPRPVYYLAKAEDGGLWLMRNDDRDDRPGPQRYLAHIPATVLGVLNKAKEAQALIIEEMCP